jgi:D-glycero-D-manno-heptose 1,7-bisphosphate phosphatase
MKPFVFLDRDGTLIVEKNYLADPDGVELIAGAAAALRRLRDAGFGIAVVTNQSGIGRGYLTMDVLTLIHERVASLLSAEGARVDAFYVCPHLPEDECACRKPGVALIERAAREYSIDRNRSFFVGDKECDIECGENAGLRSVLVRTGYGASAEPHVARRADFTADSLPEAVDLVLSAPGL